MDPRAGRLLVVDQTASTVSTVDARDHRVLTVSPVAQNPTTWALDDETAGGRFLVGGDTTVSILDTRTGAVAHTVALGDVGNRKLKTYSGGMKTVR